MNFFLLTITGRSRCWSKIQILSMTHMRNCHEQSTENWEDENIHCLHYFFWKKKLEIDEKVEYIKDVEELNFFKNLMVFVFEFEVKEKMVLVFIGRGKKEE